MTYSIIAREPNTGELGIAVQSRYFAAGQVVPWIEAGVGVIASQSFANPVYGYEGLRLLRSGMAPQDVLDKLVREDAGEATRQVAIMDAQGRVAVHTGAKCVAAAGHALGTNCCAQANMMAQDTVWQAMVHAFEHSSSDLADRLLAAMEAAEREGGDLRGKQAAGLIVVSGNPSGVSKLDRVVDVRVDDHPAPIGEIKRLLQYARAHQCVRQATDKVVAGDFNGALADLDVCLIAYPDEPQFLFRRALVLLPLGRFEEAREMVQHAHNIHPGWSEILLRFADAGIVPVSRDIVASLVAGLAADNRSSRSETQA
jgi:uncharacterized Ntn-hydrolase superfamily protein